MTVKKIFALFLAVALAVSLAACNDTTAPLNDSTPAPLPSSETATTPLEQSQTEEGASEPSPTPEPILFHEITAQVKDDMPFFMFRASGEYKQYTEPPRSNREPLPYITDLEIINAETNAIVNHFNYDYLEARMELLGIPEDNYQIELIDMNFDGWKDVRIFVVPNGTWNKSYLYYIWDAENALFIEDPYHLGSLALPMFDEDTQLVHSSGKDSSADHWFYTHKYINGDLVLTEEVTDNRLWKLHELDETAALKIRVLEPLFDAEKTFFQHYVKRQLDMDTMEMLIIEDEYRLYPSEYDDYIPIAEHDYESELGVLLRAYE
jgi:hypothetical protein